METELSPYVQNRRTLTLQLLTHARQTTPECANMQGFREPEREAMSTPFPKIGDLRRSWRSLPFLAFSLGKRHRMSVLLSFVMMRAMIDRNEPRMVGIPLRDVCFYEELPVLLGVSAEYVRHLCKPSDTEHGAWYKKQNFPLPFHVSPSGIRVWFRKDIERWALGLRLKRTGIRRKTGIPLLDSPATINELFGL